jgi:hypothetical protein
MALVDRYLQAVKFWLPRKQKDDIIAELYEDLRSQIEDQETELGRKLTDTEVEPILKRCGSPMAVAERYLPQRSLIGPALFPIYSVVIRALLFYFLLPWLLLWLGITIFSPDFRADHPGAALFASLEPWWLACTYSLFFNTLVFALLDRSQARSHLVNQWSPRALPSERDHNRISRGVTITLSSHWPYFFWGLVVLTLAGIGISGLNLSAARWTRLSASLRLVIDGCAWGLIYCLCRANLLESLSGSDVGSTDAAKLVNSLNFWMASSAVWVLAIGIVVVVFDVRRILRVGATA